MVAAKPSSPIGVLCEKKQKFLFFVYFHNTCTQNSDYLILFIKTNNAHKAKILSHVTFNTLKKCNRKEDGNIIKNDSGSEIMVVFTITEVSLFFDLVRAILYLYLRY